MNRCLAILGVLLASMTLSHAAIRQETVNYRQGDTALEGVVVYDDARTDKRPGVLVVHQWKGLGPYERKRAEMLAGLGYVAFCADIYGEGVRATNRDDAAKLAARYKEDRALLRARVTAALDQLRRHPLADTSRLA